MPPHLPRSRMPYRTVPRHPGARSKMGQQEPDHRRTEGGARHGRGTLLAHTSLGMEGRGEEDEGGWRDPHCHLRLLEPHRGTGGYLQLERTAQPKTLHRDMRGGTTARHPAHRPLLPRRGAQRRHPRLDVCQRVQDAFAGCRVPDVRRKALPTDFLTGTGTAMEGWRTAHSVPV